MPIAATTGTFYPRSTLKSVEQLKSLDIQDIELTLQQNEFSLNFERKLSMSILPDLESLVQRGELWVRSVHAPMVHSERAYNLWARLRCLAHSIEVCRQLGGQIVVIHPFHLFRTHEDALGYLATDNPLLETALLPGIRNILNQARAANIILALENIQDWYDEIFFNLPQNMLRFLSDLNHPFLQCTLDLMHAQVVGTLEEFTSSLAEHIVNVHASDLLPPVERVAVGKGVIDWDRLIPTLQSLPSLRQITVELSNPPSDEVLQSVKFLSTRMS